MKELAQSILGTHYDSYFSENTAVEILYGGLNGSLVLRIGDDFVLRKNRPQLNKSFTLELEIFEIVSKRGLAPKIFYSDKSEGIVLMEYIDDDSKAKLKNHQTFIQALGQALSSLHQIPLETVFKNTSVNPSKNIFDSIFELMKEVRDQGYFWPFEHDEFLAEMMKLRGEFNQDVVLSHRDTNFGNVLFEKKGVKFIDFEVSSVDNRYVDLATIDNFYLHSHADRILFLESYFQRRPDEREFEKFVKMTPVTHLYHALQLALIAKDKEGLCEEEIAGLIPLHEMENLIYQGKINLFDDAKNIIKLIYALVFEANSLLAK